MYILLFKTALGSIQDRWSVAHPPTSIAERTEVLIEVGGISDELCATVASKVKGTVRAHGTMACV